MKRDIMIWPPERKSILRHLVTPSSPDPGLDGKLMLIWYRFPHEATIIISYRFLFEVIGQSVLADSTVRICGRQCKTR
jgi:hypothetical protein